MDRTILHCDANSFFASVETTLHPEYAAVPMAVCGSKKDRHGIVLAKNDHAKKYGVKTGETIGSALEKCSSLVIAEPHYDLYSSFSKEMAKIFYSYTDLIEPFGMDESWLDVTASRRLFGDGRQIADRLRADIKKKLGITVSVGVSFNKVFAKLCSDLRKPDATTVVLREDFKRRLYPLPASMLLFAGRRTVQTTDRLGMMTIGDVASAGRDIMVKKLGKCGGTLWEYANGFDDSPVDPDAGLKPMRSVSNGMTFRRNLRGRDDVSFAVNYLSDEIARRMRTYGAYARTVEVTIRNKELQSINRSKRINTPTNLAKDIARGAMGLIEANYDLREEIYSLTVGAGDITYSPVEQIGMFDYGGYSEKRYDLECTVDRLRQRFGKNAVVLCSSIGNTLGVEGALRA